LQEPDAIIQAFVGFCRTRHKRAPIQRQAASYDE
jgi:hypothetical protein